MLSPVLFEKILADVRASAPAGGYRPTQFSIALSRAIVSAGVGRADVEGLMRGMGSVPRTDESDMVALGLSMARGELVRKEWEDITADMSTVERLARCVESLQPDDPFEECATDFVLDCLSNEMQDVFLSRDMENSEFYRGLRNIACGLIGEAGSD